MKFDIENLLYIIVVIVWIVAGFLRKRKKKAGPPPPAMPPVSGEKETPDFSEMLEEILGKKPEEKTPAPIYREPEIETVQKDEAQSLETISGSDFAQRSVKKTEAPRIHPAKSIEEQKLKQARQAQRPAKTAAQSTHSTPEFDLRSAVIMAEILNPPYK